MFWPLVLVGKTVLHVVSSVQMRANDFSHFNLNVKCHKTLSTLEFNEFQVSGGRKANIPHKMVPLKIWREKKCIFREFFANFSQVQYRAC